MINVRALFHIQNSAGEWVPVQENPVIHNYFPDGAINSAALIDVANDQDFDTHIWTGYASTETLARETHSARPAVAVTIAGWSQGVSVKDWSNHYGAGALPIGRYRVGFDLAVDVLLATVLRVDVVGGNGGSNEPVMYSEFTVHNPGSSWRRHILDVYTRTVGPIGIEIYALESDNPNAEAPPEGQFWVTNLMITEGDPAAYRDGSFSGWSWAGTPHASASHGPQP